MILGIGTDIVEISRIAKAVQSKAFLAKCYTEAEISRCDAESFAGHFAAKEAVAKALGTGFNGFVPRDIEICHDDFGRPICRLAGHINIPDKTKMHISISYSKEYAIATAVLSKEL